VLGGIVLKGSGLLVLVEGFPRGVAGVLLDAALGFAGPDRLHDKTRPKGVGRVGLWVKPDCLGAALEDGGDVLGRYRRLPD